MSSGETFGGPIIPDGTVSLLHTLVGLPRPDVRCSLVSGDMALGVLLTPAGCAARPNDRIQALCEQHLDTYGVFDEANVWPILDLTENEAWSRAINRQMPLSLGYSALQLQKFLDGIAHGAL